MVIIQKNRVRLGESSLPIGLDRIIGFGFGRIGREKAVGFTNTNRPIRTGLFDPLMAL